MRYEITMKIVSAMDKVMFKDGAVNEEYSGVTLKNQSHCFQLAINTLQNFPLYECSLKVVGDLSDYVKMQSVDNVPVALPPASTDDYYLGGIGLYPDVLRPFNQNNFILPACNWKSFWVEISANELPVGVHKIGFQLFDKDGDCLAERFYNLEVLDALLKKAPLKTTNWIHYDCIANTHKVEPFSNEFYRVFKWYLDEYVKDGFKMLLTPLFTPPLDTYIGGERKTAQLVEIECVDTEYKFDFSKLERFIRFAFENGIKYIEFSHLFTQWGGEHCPKIMANVNGKEEKIFGWDDDAIGEKYQRFLCSFLPELMQFIQRMDIRKKCFFHLTDEPNEKQIGTYAKHRALIKQYIGDIPTIDALSHYEYCEKGLVDIPVPLTSCVKDFLGKKVENIFTYYCCIPAGEYYSNRMLPMPLQRMRIIGLQLYESGINGFLHWGFNFYNSGLSYYEINPYQTTDADGMFPSGDAFIVYPRQDGVNSSLRAQAMRMAFDDYNALYTLEQYIGREKVVELLHSENVKGYQTYPRSARWHTSFLEKVNRLIEKNQNNKK